ncbi:MAG: hypothetical protein KDD82_19535 [Planctomycetes bacterium]|nr:hypothetical protein [Planctomycetota bacterium]
MSALQQPFYGAGALIRDRLPLLGKVTLVAFPCLALWGLVIRVFDLSTAELPPLLLILGVLPPLLSQVGLTFGGSTSDGRLRARSRELLELPLGRLALPSAALCVALLGCAIGALGVLLCAGVGGFLPELEAFLTPDADQAWLPALFVVLGVGVHCAIQVGSRSPQFSVWCVAVAGFLVVGALAWSGWGEADLERIAWLGGGGLLVFYLGLPFVLGALGPHRDELFLGRSSATRGRAWVACAWVLAFCGLICGLSWILLPLGAGAALWARSVARKAPPARAMSAFSVSHLLLGLCLLPALVCLVGVELSLPFRPCTPAWSRAQVSPDGRWIALPLRRDGTHQTLVAILDAHGEHPARTVSTRMGHVARWSSDSQRLAIHEQAWGRVRVADRSSTGEFLDHFDAADSWDAWLARWVSNASSTWIAGTDGGVQERTGRRLIGLAWNQPSELVTLEVSQPRTLCLPDGSLAPLPRRVSGFAGYTRDGAPLVTVTRGEDEGRLVFLADWIEPLGSELLAWRDGAWTADTGFYTVRIDVGTRPTEAEPARPRVVSLVNADDVLPLESATYAWVDPQERAALALEGRRLVRYDLDRGLTTTAGEGFAFASEGSPRPAVAPQVARQLLSDARGQLVWVGPRLALLPLPELRGELLWLGPQALLVRDDAELRTLSWEGEVLHRARLSR